MSKIYEALQRAEQERLATIPEALPEAAAPLPIKLPVKPLQPVPPETLPTPSLTSPESLYEFPSLETGRDVIQHAPIQPDPIRQSPPAPSATTTLAPIDIAAIPATAWTPNLEKLPSLAERGIAVEQFRSLRTRLIGFRDLNKLKSVLVSSGLPREGKSFIAANLAVSLARHKSTRVLLIDGDMRRSSQHTLLGCAKSPGLSTYLAGDATIQQILQRPLIQPDSPPILARLGSLTFIGGGEEGDKAADLSGSPRFRQLIEHASETFDWIIVDSSPVNLVTDGVNLASACDAVLMVARGGVTKFEAAQRALNELKASKILGVVLNAVHEMPASEGYYGYSSYDSLEAKTDQNARTTDQHAP